MTRADRLLLGLRVLMEIGVVAGLAFWGYETGGNASTKVLLAVGAPLVGFGVWGAIDFRWMRRLAEPLRLVEELAISALAALGLITIGQATLGWALAMTSVGYHALVYLTGHRLLARSQNAPPDTNDRRDRSWTSEQRTVRP